ncbi:hypothetical protein O181_068612 [Austropuccinia psidii MF-1]|uniref:Fanconi-associated nuclease n=1 Tax=Austropuccinia psidii MF-1 TaxID=1389203 RepID=A0A9Q3I6G2_9BASI|nr:hypothetical protein [Austropuccinia psidii MF-1]
MSNTPSIHSTSPTSPTSPTHSNHSSASSASSSSSSSASSASSKTSPFKNKKFKTFDDKFQISSNQWTPIDAGSIEIRQNKSLNHQKFKSKSNSTNDSINQINHHNLVRLFDSEIHLDSSNLELNQFNHQFDPSILVSIDQKISLYVSCFEEILSTVLNHEHYLFSQSELKVLYAWNALSYSSKYLFVRLFMRKHSNWFRLDKLTNYQSDLGDLSKACQGLCRPIDQLFTSINSDQFNHHHLNLNLTNHHLDSFQNPSAEFQSYSTFQPNSSNITPELVQKWCLLTLNLSNLTPQSFNPYGIHQHSILHDSASNLSYSPIPPPVPIRLIPTSSSIIDSSQPIHSPIFRPTSPPALDLFEQDFISFASMTSNDYSSLSTDDLFACMSLDELKTFAKQLHTNPHTTRDMIILGLKAATKTQSTLHGAKTTRGRGRKQLSLKFNQKGLKESQSLALNKKILKIIGPCIKLSPTVSALIKRLHLVFYRSTTATEKAMTASILTRMNIRAYPSYHVNRSNQIFESRRMLLKYEKALELEQQFEDLLTDDRKSMGDDNESKLRRQEAKGIRRRQALELFESAWLDWQQVVMEENEKSERRKEAIDMTLSEAEHDRLTYYKKRFHPGWPLTRIVYKASGIYSQLKEYNREVQVLEALLQQTHFRRGKRGQWYDRLALVLMRHLSHSTTDPENREHHLMSAAYTCTQGLKDPDTHQIYRLSLTRRLNRLNSMGITGLSKNVELVDDLQPFKKNSIYRTKLSDDHEIGRKSSWLGIFDSAELTVEEVCLEHYTSKGWRGFHSETQILKMIFSLIFWDILFAPVDGAFETSFQTAPLDLTTDAFAIVRRPLIEDRVDRLKDRGIIEATERLIETYKRESSKKTLCIGINWEKFQLEDLLEIVKCLGLKAVLKICQVFSEDWLYWSTGGPDLCLWKSDENVCRFVEVKGPGDKLSEKQKAWINLLAIDAGIEVEVCSVKEV